MGILELARTLWQTDKARSLRAADYGSDNNEHEIPAHSPILIAHIFVLLMYCDYTVLQNLYKKNGCRPTTDIQSFDDPNFKKFKETHKEIAWWYRLMRDGVLYWGTQTNEGDIFYTGLDRRMVFSTMNPQWNCPVSTTVSELVALNFATEQGIILKMTPGTGSRDRYFDCEWLSDYPDERERLFVYAENLQIADIHSMKDRFWKSHRRYIQCLTLFSSLFRGHFVSPMIKKMENEIAMDKVLLSMLHRYAPKMFVRNGIDVEDMEMDSYVEHLCMTTMEGFKNFKNLRTRENKHFVIKSQFQSLSDSLQKQLLLFDDADNMSISPFLNSLGCSLNNTFLMKEYIWKVKESDVARLNAGRPGYPMYSKDYLYKDSSGFTAKFCLAVARAQRVGGFQASAFGLRINEMSHRIGGGQWSVNIDEVNWHRNAKLFRFLPAGQCEMAFAFQDDSYDSIKSFTIQFAVYFHK